MCEGNFICLHTCSRHEDVKVREGTFTHKQLIINVLLKREGVKALFNFLYGKNVCFVFK